MPIDSSCRAESKSKIKRVVEEEREEEKEEVSNEEVENEQNDDIIFVKEYKKILASTIRRTTVNKECFYSDEFLNTFKKETYYSETLELCWNIETNRTETNRIQSKRIVFFQYRVRFDRTELIKISKY